MHGKVFLNKKKSGSLDEPQSRQEDTRFLCIHSPVTKSATSQTQRLATVPKEKRDRDEEHSSAEREQGFTLVVLISL